MQITLKQINLTQRLDLNKKSGPVSNGYEEVINIL